MDCSKCEEAGLLLASGELDQAQTDEMHRHLADCPPCKEEFSQYSLEKKRLFTLLCETTSPDLDHRIVTLCCRPAVPTGMGLFSSAWIKRAALSALIFALGLTAGGYFTYAYYQTRTSGSYAARDKGSTATQSASVAGVSAAARKNNDTAQNQPPAAPTNEKRISPGAGASSQGIVTVDLKKE
jgi:anti-sigma factor RsiW